MKTPDRPRAICLVGSFSALRNDQCGFGCLILVELRGAHNYGLDTTAGWGTVCGRSYFCGAQEAALSREMSFCISGFCFKCFSASLSMPAAARILRHQQPVVHPLALASGSDDSRASQVGKMSRNLGLAEVQNFHKITNTDLAIRN